MKSNKWNIILAACNMLMSILFVINIGMPKKTISTKVCAIVAFFYMLSGILYFCIYVQNKKDKC